MIKAKVRETINANGLFPDHASVMVALSGGADSVAMLRVLLALGYGCVALHCNFHLRGGESDRDEAFVRALCAKLGVECEVKHFDTAAYARQKGVSIEMAAREQRYAWFAECLDAGRGDVTAVAHNADDNVETLLINLTRGSGLRGLTGIPVRNGRIVRPLLHVTRGEIISYLDALHQDYVTDSTNLEDNYTRNKFRLHIIPMLEAINPSFKTTACRTAERLREAAEICDEAIAAKVARIRKGDRIDIALLSQERAQATLLHAMLHPLGFNSSQIEDIRQAITAQPGKTFEAGDCRLTRGRDAFVISRASHDNDETVLADGDTTPFALGTLAVARCTATEALAEAKKSKTTAYLDARAVKGTLRVRRWRHGDWFIPFGMRGRKNISDLLTDLHKDLAAKDETYVVTDGGNIAWVVGERTDNRYRVTRDTEEAIKITYTPNQINHIK